MYGEGCMFVYGVVAGVPCLYMLVWLEYHACDVPYDMVEVAHLSTVIQ